MPRLVEAPPKVPVYVLGLPTFKGYNILISNNTCPIIEILLRI
jgi:hypothetical protein